ncbi:GL14491 [Drosophila persimilis]|uniref:GL14491 n=1 Tax=Drosophila persimilis TaxID=7234 RepID=B4GQB7_DROPE|nr:GL14491 [Drosophila persimilis]
MHTDERPYKCTNCSKSFLQKSKLDAHIRTHTGDRPYKCSHCSKSFQQNAHLQVHSRTHTGELPYKCSHCSRSFKYKNKSYQRHILTHTKNDKCAIPALF